MASDPNFPLGGLDILPSHQRFALRSAAHHDSRRREHPDGKEAQWSRDTAADITKFGIAGRIWEAAYVLCGYLTPPSSDNAWEFSPSCSIFEKTGDNDSDVYVVELGAGVGFVGIHLALMLQRHRQSTSRATVLLTDLENVVPLMQRNIDAAMAERQPTPLKETPMLLAKALPWGSRHHADDVLADAQKVNAQVTHIICSDLVYFTELLAPLLRTLIDLTERRQKTQVSPQVIIGYKIRSLPKEEPFWRAFGTWFDFEPVLCRRKESSDGAAPCNNEEISNEWHRFGSLDIHFERDEAKNEQGGSHPSEDDVYCFVAARKEATFSFLAPRADSDLMSGMMQPVNASAMDSQLTQGMGADTFECLRMAEATPFDI